MSRAMKWVRLILLLLVLTAIGAGIAVGMKPQPVPVEIAAVDRGNVTVTVDGEGRCRMVQRYTIAAPISGELQRIEYRPGDPVRQGDLLATISPGAPQMLDARSLAELKARLAAVKVSGAMAKQEVERAKIALDFARRESERARQLVATDSLPQRSLDVAISDEQSKASELALAQTRVEQASMEVAAVQAMIGDPKGKDSARRAEIRSPSDGVVLSVFMESEGPVAVGSSLLEIGDPASLEFVVDLPTRQAMKVRPGTVVRVDGTGLDEVLEGTVTRVEPAAFTRVTALGVEEQRVKVVSTPGGDLSFWAKLGEGYAGDAHFEVHRATDVLRVPVAAVFRDNEGHAVFVVRNSSARRATVKVGARSARHVEILLGLKEGDSVILHPSDRIADGVPVEPEH